MIPLFACGADNAIYQLDDITSDVDPMRPFHPEDIGPGGSPLVAKIVSVPFESKLASVNTLREISQALSITESATVVIEPIVDEARDPAGATTFNLTAAVDGQAPDAEAMPFGVGSRFQIEIRVEAHKGVTQLGECDIGFNVKRGMRS